MPMAAIDHEARTRWFRWRSLLPLGIAVLFGAALVLLGVGNLVTVRETAEQAQVGRARSQAAKLLGIARRTLQYKLKKLGIE